MGGLGCTDNADRRTTDLQEVEAVLLPSIKQSGKQRGHILL